MASEHRLRIALAQINTTVGDIEGNTARIREAIAAAHAERAQVVVLPELAIPGYPPEDLLLKRHFLDANREALEQIAAEVDGIVALVGFAEADGFVHNALGVLADGEVKATYSKMLLPNYGVFDERRYFEPGPSPALIEVGAAVALCNAVGGQDELVFDGHSVVVDDHGETIGRAASFEEDLLVCDLELPPSGTERRPAEVPGGMDATIVARADVPEPQGTQGGKLAEPLGDDAEVYEALKLGLRDYVDKNGFQRVVLALSGGIDSSLVALVAADALGPERVTCVVMPSPYSSEGTQADARATAANLGAELVELSIESVMRAYAELLEDALASAEERPAPEPALAGNPNPAPGQAIAPDHVEENVQARIRGNLVMALSNRFGWLVLTTGNKSELSVGYATLYGDMAGGFAVIKDCFKTLVYRLVPPPPPGGGGGPLPPTGALPPPPRGAA